MVNFNMDELNNKYKNTLLMMKTDFEMKANLPKNEPLYQQIWFEKNLYQKLLEKNENCAPFIIHDGPTLIEDNVTIGQAVNKVLKDIIVRYKAMSRHYVPFHLGWEVNENEIVTTSIRNEYPNFVNSDQKIRDVYYDLVHKKIAIQEKDYKRLGVLADWSHSYSTYDKEYHVNQLNILSQMVRNKLIYRGLKPAFWSIANETVLLESDITYKPTELNSLYFTFNVVDGKGIISPDCELVVWTLSPWTLFANMALSALEDAEYVVLLAGDRYFVLASDLVEHFILKSGMKDAKVVRRFLGKSLQNVTYYNPFNKRTLPVIITANISFDEGSGIHLLVPGHSDADFYNYKAYNNEVLCPIDGKGYLTEEAFSYAGTFYIDAIPQVIGQLAKSGNLIKNEMVIRTYPHEWRTNAQVIYRTTSQWFVDLRKVRDQVIKIVKEINWLPHWAQDNMIRMIVERDDWCISRQRAFGTVIPSLYTEDGTVILSPEVIDNVARLIDEKGIDVWYDLSVDELLPEGYQNEHSPNNIFYKELDTFDISFDLGVAYCPMRTFSAMKGRPQFDLYLEGIDQLHDLFNSTLIISSTITPTAPYKNAYVHGYTTFKSDKDDSFPFTVDSICNKYGADVFRLWVASVQSKNNYELSTRVLSQHAETYRKIRNTFRFMLGNIYDFSYETDRVDYNSMVELDQYMVNLLNKLVENSLNSFENYDFDNIYREIAQHLIINASAFYLDVVKDILYMNDAKSIARRSVQTVLYEHVYILTKLLAPIIPHTAEEIYSYLKIDNKPESVFLTDMPIVSKYANTSEILNKYNDFQEVRSDILRALEKARNDKIIGRSEEAIVTFKPKEKIIKLLYSIKYDIKKMLKVADFIITLDEVPGDYYDSGAIAISLSDGFVCSRCRQITHSVDEDSICERCHAVVHVKK